MREHRKAAEVARNLRPARPSHLVSSRHRHPADLPCRYPIGTAVFFLVGFVLIFFLGGYLFNVCQGLRGTAAIPLYLYFSSSLSASDYTLKQ